MSRGFRPAGSGKGKYSRGRRLSRFVVQGGGTAALLKELFEKESLKRAEEGKATAALMKELLEREKSKRTKEGRAAAALIEELIKKIQI